MTNAELIAGLRECATVGDCSKCKMHDEYSYDMCARKLLLAAADTIQTLCDELATYHAKSVTDEKRIVNLLTALHLANEKLAYVDCQPYTEIDGEEMIDDWVKTLVYEELHTHYKNSQTN